MKFASIAVVASLNLILHESSVYGWSSWGESESDHKPTRRPTKLPSSSTWSWANPWDSSGSGGNGPTNWVWNGWDSWTGDGWNGGKHTSPPTVKLTGSPVTVTTSPSERKVTNTPSEFPSTMPVVTLLEIPKNPDDFGEPDWVKIIEIAFPTWDVPEDAPSAIGISEDINRCPRLTEIGGDLDPDFSQTFLSPKASAGLWNPCYYTKAAAGLNPSLGGYPTPIDTRYPYEFAAPYNQQPGDGSTHHCPADASNDIDIGRCPKIKIGCGTGPDCVEMSVGTDFSPIGHIPPFVPLAAVKKAYNSGDHDVCKEWFDGNIGCNIKIDKLDELVIEYFGVGNQIKFQPPILLDGVPSSTYYKLEYGGEQPACTDGKCFGPHYCTKDVGNAGGIWGDFCPYVHTGAYLTAFISAMLVVHIL